MNLLLTLSTISIMSLFFTEKISAQTANSGPTLVICSGSTSNTNSIPEQYSTSKTRTFDIPGEYKMMQVGPSYTTNVTNGVYRYLNEVLNNAMGWNYRRIIILAGDYEVSAPIILNTWGTDGSLSIGKITIEGEGFGTRIKNASTYTSGNIFEVRSYFNTIKNLSILSENLNTCLAITTDSSSVDPKHNVFENLYLGHKTMSSNTSPPSVTTDPNATGNSLRIGISINSSNKQIGFNSFKNITFSSIDKGIELTGALRLHDNHFENLVFENTIIGVDFLANTATTDNIFNNLTIQTDIYTKNLVRGITGRHNSFSALNHNDWNSSISNADQPNISFVTISDKAEHTTIQNSEVGRNTVVFLTDAGKYTQLINNYGGNSDVTYKIGNDRNLANASAISLTEILGQLKISGNNTTNDPTFAANKVLTCQDSTGRAVWANITGTGGIIWDYKAISNIKLQGSAIINSATTDTPTSPGLRLDNLGNVRIGTVAPFTTNPAKLQVDGRTIIGTANDGINALTSDYKLIVNGKVRVKDEVFIKSAGLTWPDYVFNKTYNLMPLSELENYIKKEKHLPNMPSAAVIEKDGVPLSEMIIKQQEKIEELTLYVIAMQKEIALLKNEPKK